MATSSIAVTLPSYMDWRKMNKQELRDALASRGLDTNGLKPLLIQRLESSVKALATAEALANDGKTQTEASPPMQPLTKSESEKLDASIRLQQDGTDLSKDGKVQDDKEVQALPHVYGADAEGLASVPTDDQEVQALPHVSGADAEGLASIPTDDATKPSVLTLAFPDNSKDDVSSLNTGTLSDLEKKRLRAKKFGVGLQVTEQEKLAIRAERFSGAQSKKSSVKKPEAEKMKERAARFGIVDEESRKKARQERFEPESKQEVEKRKARAARFGAATEQGSLKVERE